MILLFQPGGHTPTHPKQKMASNQLPRWRFAGKQGNQYVVTDGIFTLYLSGKEFRTFDRWHETV